MLCYSVLYLYYSWGSLSFVLCTCTLQCRGMERWRWNGTAAEPAVSALAHPILILWPATAQAKYLARPVVWPALSTHPSILICCSPCLLRFVTSLSLWSSQTHASSCTWPLTAPGPRSSWPLIAPSSHSSWHSLHPAPTAPGHPVPSHREHCPSAHDRLAQRSSFLVTVS